LSKENNTFNYVRVFFLIILLVGLIFFFDYLFSEKQAIKIIRLKNGRYQLLVNAKPMIIRGFVYQPIPITQNHSYDFWSDPAKPWMIDGKLMKEAGANAVRFFEASQDLEKTRQAVDKLYRNFGIRTAMGHWVGFFDCPNYSDPSVRERIKEDVVMMVKALKDEPGILMWILGNENNRAWGPDNICSWTSPEISQIKGAHERNQAKAKVYYAFINELAKEIKKVDKTHLVAMGNADLVGLEIAKELCPFIDVAAITSYRGRCFGNFWREAKEKFAKPIFLSELGCDSYNAQLESEDEDNQALFIKYQWLEVERNTANQPGEGNCLGGFIFEFTDEWWKHNEYDPQSWKVHDTKGDWFNPAYYFDEKVPDRLNINEEWWGVVGLSPELENGLNKRVPKKAYYYLQELWTANHQAAEGRP
jgi:hypothetical protein